MTLAEFIEPARIVLCPYRSKKGCLIYSATATLRENHVLVYGLNPGQDPEVCHPSSPLLEASIKRFAEGQPNLITEEAWFNPQNGVDYEPGEAPYQRQITHILTYIGHPDALVTDLYFVQTKTANELRTLLRQDPRLEGACWAVHRAHS